jgi:hypothetical protein
VRIGAAAALTGIPQRSLFADTFVDVLRGIVPLALGKDELIKQNNDNDNNNNNGDDGKMKKRNDGALLYGRKLRNQYCRSALHLLSLLDNNDVDDADDVWKNNGDALAHWLDKAFNAALMTRRRAAYKQSKAAAAAAAAAAVDVVVVNRSINADDDQIDIDDIVVGAKQMSSCCRSLLSENANLLLDEIVESK